MNAPAEPVVELLTIGREILDGRVIDTNAVRMAELLRPLGLVPRHGQRVDDQFDRVIDAYRIAGSRSNVILVTGGLGPTSDDLTIEAFARFLGEPLELRGSALEDIRAFLQRMGRPTDGPTLEAQRKQAMMPRSCFVLPNPEGTAPGVGYEAQGRQWFFMPGVPREMLRMLKEQVLPRLPRREGYRAVSWITQFTAESLLQKRLSEIEATLPRGFEITYQTRFPENHVGLCGDAADPELARRFKEIEAAIGRELGDDAFLGPVNVSEIEPLEAVVSDLLRTRGRWIYCVEEATGGTLASRLSASGSKTFLGATVLEPLAAGTDPENLGERAKRLAEGALESLRFSHPDHLERAIAVSVTGHIDAGQVWIALAQQGKPTETHEAQHRLAADNERFRKFASQKALDLVRRSVSIS